jgi:hypothetical protein
MDYDDYESYGYDQLEYEYFGAQIYTQEEIDDFMETAIQYGWFEWSVK